MTRDGSMQLSLCRLLCWHSSINGKRSNIEQQSSIHRGGVLENISKLWRHTPHFPHVHTPLSLFANPHELQSGLHSDPDLAPIRPKVTPITVLVHLKNPSVMAQIGEKPVTTRIHHPTPLPRPSTHPSLPSEPLESPEHTPEAPKRSRRGSNPQSPDYL